MQSVEHHFERRIHQTLCAGALLVLGSVFVIPLAGNPASLGDTQGIFEGIRSNALHVTAHYILLTGFLCMAAGSIGVALGRLGLLGQTRHRGVTGGGKNFLAVVLLGVVPPGRWPLTLCSRKGVMRLAASPAGRQRRIPLRHSPWPI